MGLEPSKFEKLIRRKRPEGARYYFLTGFNRQHKEVRIPTRGAFRAIDPFQYPTANPGPYFVRYCRDSAGHELISGRKGVFYTTVALEDTAQEQSGHSSTEYAAFEDAVLRSAPPTASHYHLRRLGGRGERVPDEGALKLRDPFQFPEYAKVGSWEVNYCRDQGKPLPNGLQGLPVWVEVKEPVGIRDEDAEVSAEEEMELVSLLSILERQEELTALMMNSKALLDDYGQRIEAIARQQPAQPDYTPVLTTLISTIRDLWLHAQKPSPASPAPPATKNNAAGTPTQPLRPAPPTPDVKEFTAAELELARLRQQLASIEAQIGALERRTNTADQRGSAPLGSTAQTAGR